MLSTSTPASPRMPRPTVCSSSPSPPSSVGEAAEPDTAAVEQLLEEAEVAEGSTAGAAASSTATLSFKPPSRAATAVSSAGSSRASRSPPSPPRLHPARKQGRRAARAARTPAGHLGTCALSSLTNTVCVGSMGHTTRANSAGSCATGAWCTQNSRPATRFMWQIRFFFTRRNVHRVARSTSSVRAAPGVAMGAAASSEAMNCERAMRRWPAPGFRRWLSSRLAAGADSGPSGRVVESTSISAGVEGARGSNNVCAAGG